MVGQSQNEDDETGQWPKLSKVVSAENRSLRSSHATDRSKHGIRSKGGRQSHLFFFADVAALIAASCSAATRSKGSMDRSARDSRTAPSHAAMSVADIAGALFAGTPPSASSALSRWRQLRNTSATLSSKAGESAATVIATPAHPARKSYFTRCARQSPMKVCATAAAGLPSRRLRGAII